jgi:hypothetical protein
MLKRSKGRLLLVLLVITGLAGTVNTNSLSTKERKYALAEMKESKTEFLKSIKGLSAQQLHYKAPAEPWSVNDYIFHVVLTEERLWKLFESTMKAPPAPAKRANITVTDDQLVDMVKDTGFRIETNEQHVLKNASWKSAGQAIAFFKELRNKNIRYMKSTTEDLRNRVVQTPLGWLDCYQLYLLIGAYTHRYAMQIQYLRNSPGFPEK